MAEDEYYPIDKNVPMGEMTREEQELWDAIGRGVDVPGWQLLKAGEQCYSEIRLLPMDGGPVEWQLGEKLFSILQEEDGWSWIHRLK